MVAAVTNYELLLIVAMILFAVGAAFFLAARSWAAGLVALGLFCWAWSAYVVTV